MKNWLDSIYTWLEQHPVIYDTISFMGVILLSVLAYLVLNNVILRTIKRIIDNTKTRFDDVMLNSVFIRRVSYLAPLIIVHEFAYLVPRFEIVIEKATESLIILAMILAMINAINSLVHLFESTERFKERPIKGYAQVVSIILFIWGVILIIGVLTGTSPWSILTGLGALTAIIILVFRDTILSFVASIQISSYELVKVGDWIEVPKFGADGDVIDISLNVIKVQNWDKTITVIPTYKLIDESFKNWRGMQQSGGRRIKRAIHIDVNSVRFLNNDDIQRMKKFKLLKEYLEQKEIELEQYNKEKSFDDTVVVNGRKLTNLGTFRKYLKEYLKNRQDVNHNMTFLVRHLEPGQNGLPVEIYIFAHTTEWVKYEDIQADIFDHVLAMVSQFDLKIFQNPSGADFRALKESISQAGN